VDKENTGATSCATPATTRPNPTTSRVARCRIAAVRASSAPGDATPTRPVRLADRYTALADTTGTPGAEAHLFAPMFACHKSPEGAEQACSGWLAAVGYYHLGVRLAIVTGRLDPRVLQPAPDWPPLFDTYQEMATTQARTTQSANPPAPPNPVPSTDLEVEPTHPHGIH
jgi:hypothetical protein